MRRAPSGGALGREDGAVLAVVIILMLALVGIGHALLVASLAEASASRAAVRHLTARAAAESAVNDVLRVGGGVWMDSVPVGAVRVVTSRSLGAGSATGAARRIDGEAWLVEGEGSVSGRGRERAALLAWSPHPLVRVLALGGAVNATSGASIVAAGTLDSSLPAAALPPMDPSACDAWQAELEAAYAQSPLSAAAMLPVPPSGDSLAAPHIGLLGLPDLLARAAPPLLSDPSGTPGPLVSFGACAEDEPWNWGDPDRPASPCASYLPLRAATGDLEVVGGVGQGILVAGGDLTFTAGARYYGLVVVRGVLRLQGGASLEGLALVRGGADVGAGSTLRASGCWAARALDAAGPSLTRLVAVPGVGALGPF